MRNRMMSILEGLESYETDSPQWQARLRQLYVLSMGEYRAEGEAPLPQKEKAVVPPPQEPATAASAPTATTDDTAPASEETKATEETKTKIIYSIRIAFRFDRQLLYPLP